MPDRLLAAALMLTAQSLTAQHLEAGAVGQNQNDALVWENAAELASSSGYVKELTLATTGRYAGLYNGNITLVAMSSAVAGGPAPGSFLLAEIVSVAGPSGGSSASGKESIAVAARAPPSTSRPATKVSPSATC